MVWVSIKNISSEYYKHAKHTNIWYSYYIGTFSISYHKHVKNCIGIEQCESAVDDALVNCSINNVSNCEFTLGKVETVSIPNEIYRFLFYITNEDDHTMKPIKSFIK